MSLKHLAIYLRQTQDWGIMHWHTETVASLPEVPYVPMVFDESPPVIPPPSHLRQLSTHFDTAHGNELRQRRSTAGYRCCLAGGVMAYRSRTQSICAQSSTEAELIAANAAAKVTKYLRFILHELGYTQAEPTPIYEDNDSAIKIVNHSQPTDHSRHVEIRYFALQHWQLMKDIILIHLPGVVNPADMLTKALGVGYSTIAMPPTSWGTMAILAGNLSWFYFQLLFLPRQGEQVLLNFIFDDLYWFYFEFFGWPFLSSFDALSFTSGEGVSGPVVRPTDKTRARCITNGYLQMKHDRGRCNGIGMISRGSLNKSSLF